MDFLGKDLRAAISNAALLGPLALTGIGVEVVAHQPLVILGAAIGGRVIWKYNLGERAMDLYQEYKNAPLYRGGTPKPKQAALLCSEGEVAAPPAMVSPARRTVNAGNTLHMSDLYRPHVNDILGHCILCVGFRGAGKSNVAARLVEQLGQYPIPMAIFDYKMDYVTLPSVMDRCVIAGSPHWRQRHEYEGFYWGVTKDNAFDYGYTIMENGVQMVFQKISYSDINEAAEIMINIIKGMFEWATEQPAGKRVPALVLLDEAQQFLPQDKSISSIDRDLSTQLLSVFEQLNSVGRSLGLTPAFFTQRVAQIRKEVIAGSEVFWLMKQALPQDFKVYEDLIGDANVNREDIRAYTPGEALVFDGGDVLHVRFRERESEHLSVTPALADAMTYYGNRRFTTSLVPRSPRSPFTEYATMTTASSSNRAGVNVAREHVNAVNEPSEPREQDEDVHEDSEHDDAVHGASEQSFTMEQAAQVMAAYLDLARGDKEPSRRSLLDYLNKNVDKSWNSGTKCYPVFQAICDEYEL